ncbi:MAG: R3H domain-containing nucleic acid-binding protein [Nitriliruptor sp.]|uniref:protein jag n=1 Tax=Nitriliruptor sp. TaxID=2448056 RepID=UPI0034A071C1
MSRRTDGRGPTLVDALREALAELLDTDTGDIALVVDAPGLDALTGRLAFDLEVVPDAAGAGDASDASDASDGDTRAGVTAPTATSPEEATTDAGGDVEPPASPAPRTRAPRGGGAAPSRSEHENPSRDGDGAGDRDRDGDRRDRDSEEEPADRVVTIEDLEEEADAAADFLEGLLDALDLPGDIRIRTTDDHAEVEVVDIGSGALIGRRGQTLEAIQELVRCALQREFQRRSRVKVDAEGYRARRMEKLVEKAEEAIDEVLDTGEPVRLEPMDVFERKSVHGIVAAVDGVTSRSQGREPARRVIIERE